VKKLRILWFLAVLLYFGVTGVGAVQAVPWPVEKTQPDGSKISVYLRGDEKVNWMESLDGYTLMYDARKNIVYAEQDYKGNLVPSATVFGQKSAPKSLARGLRYSKAQINTLKQIWSLAENVPAEPQFSPAAQIGEKKAVCILVDFPDRAMVHTQSEFEALMNQIGYSAGGAKGSVRDFFLENSYGQLDFTVTVVGPYTTPQNMSYYGQGYLNDTYYRQFADFAVNAADADVNYADYAVNGKVESIHIIFAGYGDESIGNHNQIWSHAYYLSDNTKKDGVSLSRYSCSPELRGNTGHNITYIGVCAHELGHVFGAPDYYDTDYEGSGGNYYGCGQWDIMAAGSWNDSGRQPAHINPYQKILYGWISPIELQPGDVISDMPNSVEEPVIYKIKANNNGEHYLLENRQKTGFDTSLPGHGLLIWHVASSFNSNATHPQNLYPVCAGSSTKIPTNSPSSYGEINTSKCPYPGLTNNHAFTDESTPAAFSWATGSGIQKPVTAINEYDGKISFEYMKLTDDPVTNLIGSATGRTVSLAWDAPANNDVAGYNIYREGNIIHHISNPNTTSFNQLNVVNGTHHYGVSATYPLIESEVTNIDVTVTDGTNEICQPPTQLGATPKSKKITLNWASIPDADTFLIYRDGTFIDTITSTQYIDTGLVYETEYHYCISALYDDGCLSETACITATTLKYKNPYFAAENLAADAGTDVVDLTWTRPYYPQDPDSLDFTLQNLQALKTSQTSQIPISYIIERDGLRLDSVSQTSFTDANLPPLWTGEYSIIAVYDENGTTKYSDTARIYVETENPYKSIDYVVANVEFNNITFQWTVEPTRKGRVYKPEFYVFEDKKFILSGIDTTAITRKNMAEGAHTYSFQAVYENGEVCTDAINKTITIIKRGDAHRKISNLNVVSDELYGNIVWQQPVFYGNIGYHSYSSGTFASTGSASTSEFTIAIRFGTDELKKYDGLSLTKIKYLPKFDRTHTQYTLRVWKGGSFTNDFRSEGTLATEQPLVNYQAGQPVEIQLENPVTIDASKELWIGVNCVTKGGSPLSLQSPVPVEGKGNLLFFNNQWTTLTELNSLQNGNWILDGTIAYFQGQENNQQLADSLIPTLQKYEILRDNEQTTETILPSINDTVNVSGEYTYTVKVVYTDNVASEPVTVIHSYISECDNAPSEVLAATTDSSVILTWNYEFVDIPGKDPTKDVLLDERFNAGLPPEWTTIDADGDNETWYWQQSDEGGVANSDSWSTKSSKAVQPDNWLITQQIDLRDGSVLTYEVISEQNFPEEHYGVYISTSDADTSSFLLLFEETLTSGAKQRTINLSDYDRKKVFVAFRHFNCTDRYSISLDNVKITAPKSANFNIYEDGKLIAENVYTTGNQFEIKNTTTGSHSYGVSYSGKTGCESQIINSNSITFNQQAIDNSNSKVYLYPNPAKAGHPFYILTDSNAVLQIFNIHGEKVRQTVSTGDKTEITIDEVGIYLIRMNGKTGMIEVR